MNPWLAVVVGYMGLRGMGGDGGTYGSYSHQKRRAARTCPNFLVELDDAFHTGDYFRAIVSA